MKKLLPILLLFINVMAFAQTDSIAPAYLRYPVIPPFTLLKIDSTNFTRDDLHKNKPTLVIFFSTDCEHCQQQTNDIITAMNDFKHVEILMATYQPFENMVKFYNYYEIAKYPHIHMGRDTQYFFPPYYKMHNLPFMALYNKKGKLLTTFEGNQTTEKILNAFEEKAE
jgi:cytochrome oxidase Cu insertion factor (SCO1/SenC/PrrC family)